MKKNILKYALIIVIFLMIILIRYMYMDTAFWYDEACSWFTSVQSFPSGIINNLMNLDLQHTPLYFFILHFWMKIFGQGETALRFLSLIFSIASIPLVYIVAKKISSKTVALFAMLVCAFSPLLSLFSVEVRMYPLAVFLVLLSLNYLIDFENKPNRISLIKLIAVNILIPYTYVGGILYNFSLILCYSAHLYRNNKSVLKKYLFYEVIEYAALIPYFLMIIYYALKRHLFVIAHEGSMNFAQIIDIIRNFFGATITTNIYWPSTEPYVLTFWFCLLVVAPCVYFIYGLISGLKIKNDFINTLFKIVLLNFALFIVCSYFKICVLTVRYLLYLLPPLFILSVLGLYNSLKTKHFKIFLTFFIAGSICFSLYNVPRFKILKEHSFKTVSLEAAQLDLSNEDIIIMPFGADAPYYFRNFESPIIYDFDFHKQVRNPQNMNYYDASMINIMKSDKKYSYLKEKINQNSIFSENFAINFAENVQNNVAKDRYVLLALYASDANSVGSIQNLRELIKNDDILHNNFVEIMFRKFLCDIFEMLSFNFQLVNYYNKNNYTYYLFKKIK